MTAHKKLKGPRSGIYILPNLFTTSGLFAGFYAIVASMRGDFELGAIAIFVAMLMDSLDGRVARLTNTQSSFGAEYDSLADIICFGLAPSMLVYNWGLASLGKPGWLVAFFYTAATALRLARFNTQTNHADKRFFVGLPSTAAGGFMAGMVWVADSYGVPGHHLWVMAAFVTIMVSLLMVSNILFHSFKDVDFKGRVPFIAVFCVLLGLVFIASDPSKVLLSIFSLYAVSGPVLAFWRWHSGGRAKRRRAKKG